MNNSQKTNGERKTIRCPECDTQIILPNNLTLGKILECPACGTESEIVDLNPFKLSPLEEEK